MDEVVTDAVERAVTLTEAGFRALMIENFGDAPFYADSVPPVTVSALTACTVAVADQVDAILGVNVLRNDAVAAVGVAAATGASLIRVNVLTGLMQTDQGPIIGRAAEVTRSRATLRPDLAVWADVFVKHAVPPPGLTLEQAAADTWERGGADALVVSGIGTGHAPDIDRFRRLRRALPEAPLVVGSGATADNLAAFVELADHVIVGTALEADGRPGAALDPRRIGEFMDSAERAGLGRGGKAT